MLSRGGKLSETLSSARAFELSSGIRLPLLSLLRSGSGGNCSNCGTVECEGCHRQEEANCGVAPPRHHLQTARVTGRTWASRHRGQRPPSLA
jgi:hypothetical protein